jgi:hypothetical protein
MDHLMPVRFRLTLERTGGVDTWPSTYVAAYSLRGAVIPFLRDAAGIDTIHGHRYTTHLPPPPNPNAATIDAEFSLLSDHVARRAHAALSKMCIDAQPLAIGGVTARVAKVAVVAAEPIPAARRRGSASNRTEFVDIRFGSVTTFATGNRRTRAVPDPVLIVKSWSSSWNAMDGCPEQCRPEVVEELGHQLEPTDGLLTWGTARYQQNPNPAAATVHAPYTMFGFTGDLTLRLHHASSPEAPLWLSRLAWLADFAGTGYHTQIGLGATRAVARSRSAGPPAVRKVGHRRMPPDQPL